MNTVDALWAACWEEDGRATPIRWQVGTPRWWRWHYARWQRERSGDKAVAEGSGEGVRGGTMRGARPARPMLILWLIFSVGIFILGGCDLGLTGSSTGVALTPASQVAHRPALSVMYCPENTPNYPRSLFQQANALVAQSVLAMLQPDSEGAIVYVTLLDKAPARPEASVLTLTLPALPPLPAVPSLTPTPTADPQSPYSAAQKQATVGAWNQQATDAYEQQLKQVQEQLAGAQRQARAWADQLRALDPPLGAGPANVWQCIQLASHRFNNTGTSEKYLILASTLPNPGSASTWYQLGAHVHVRWFTGCSDIASCRAGEDAWGRALSAAGVGDHLFFDSGETQTLNDLFGSPHAP
jgi:hypothetical protein